MTNRLIHLKQKKPTKKDPISQRLRRPLLVSQSLHRNNLIPHTIFVYPVFIGT